MGLLKCSRCGASIEKDSLQEAVDHLDHSVGKSNGFPCPNDPKLYPVFWNGVAVHFKDGKPIEPQVAHIRSPHVVPSVTVQLTPNYSTHTNSTTTTTVTASKLVSTDSHSKPRPKKKK